MEDKKCIICNKVFSRISPKQKCCSKECSKINDAAYQKKYQSVYKTTDKYKASQAKYRLSDARKISNKRYYNKIKDLKLK